MSQHFFLEHTFGWGTREFYCNTDKSIQTFTEEAICPKCGKSLYETAGWTKEYQPFHKYYEKDMVDIKTKSGDEVLRCWPNAGFMNPMSTKGNPKGYKEIPYSDVAEVRLTHDPTW